MSRPPVKGHRPGDVPLPHAPSPVLPSEQGQARDERRYPDQDHGGLGPFPYEVEMFFGHPTNDWYRGKVVGVVNGKPDVVKIAWDKKGLHADDKAETIEKLIAKKYNPKKRARAHGGSFSRIKISVVS